MFGIFCQTLDSEHIKFPLYLKKADNSILNSKLYFVGGLNVVHATLCAFPNIVFDIVNSQCIRCTLLSKAVHTQNCRPQISDSDSVHKEKCKLMGCVKEQCSEYSACSAYNVYCRYSVYSEMSPVTFASYLTGHVCCLFNRSRLLLI